MWEIGCLFDSVVFISALSENDADYEDDDDDYDDGDDDDVRVADLDDVSAWWWLITW